MNHINQEFLNNSELVLDNSYGKFYRFIIRDIETILLIRNDEVLINYSKIVNTIKENRDEFRKLIQTDYFLNHVKYYYIKHNQTLNKTNKFKNITELIRDTNELFINLPKLDNDCRGTFGPVDFIDTILITIDPSYADLVFSLLNQVQINSNINHISFKRTLENEINNLTKRNLDLTKQINKLKEDKVYLKKN